MMPSRVHYNSHVSHSNSNEYYNADMYGPVLMNNNDTLNNNNDQQRTVYLGNITSNISVSDIMDQVKIGPIQAIRPLPEKNGLFITFVDAASAAEFYHEATRNCFQVFGQGLKIGWGKPTTLTATISNALQNGATRNVYLGLLDPDTTEQALRQDLSRFGHIEHIRLIVEKRIAFVHFLCISNAVRCVNTLQTESQWQSKRINFGKDRCQQQMIQKMYVQPSLQPPPPPPTPQQQGIKYYDPYTGLPLMSPSAMHQQQQQLPFSGVANRTVYLGNIHPDTTCEDLCNVIRGGILSQIRFMPEKHIAFITFVDPTVAEHFIGTTDCLVVKNRRLKLGWGKPSSLPMTVLNAIQNGGSRNVYIGNIDHEVMTEEKLKHDFAEYGDIELVNALKEKNCAFVNFTSIAGAIRAIEGIRTKEEYKKLRINYGKDRCGNPPRSNSGSSTNTTYHIPNIKQEDPLNNAVLSDNDGDKLITSSIQNNDVLIDTAD